MKAKVLLFIVILFGSIGFKLFAQDSETEEEGFYKDVDQLEEGATQTEEKLVSQSELKVEKKGKSRKWPFRGSVFTYENSFSSLSLARDVELTYNPYYAMSYNFRPRWYFTDKIYVGFRISLEQELTNSDETTHYREPLWSDAFLDFVFSDILKDSKYTGITFTPGLRFVFPTSLASQARTQWLGVAPSVAIARTFDILKGLTLMYQFRFYKYFNEYTTAKTDSPVVQCIPGASGDCGRFINSGERNPSWKFDNLLELSLNIIDDLYFTMDVIFINQILYPVSEVDICNELQVNVITQPGDCKVEGDKYNTDMRASIWYIFEVGYSVLPWLSLALGTSTLNPQLTPSSEYRAPFFNRYTVVYFDITITFDKLVDAFIGVKEEGEKIGREIAFK